jgi:hypothetical protein
MKALNTLIAALIVVSASAYAAPSQAATATRIAVNHASAACLGSLPVDRDMTRVRSSGMANVDAGVSDIKCGGASTPLSGYSDVEVYEIALRNESAASVDVDCMLTDGLGEDITGVTTSYPRTVTIGPGEVAWIDWTTADTGGSNFSYPSASCQLATDVSIAYTAVVFQEDVGL